MKIYKSNKWKISKPYKKVILSNNWGTPRLHRNSVVYVILEYADDLYWVVTKKYLLCALTNNCMTCDLPKYCGGIIPRHEITKT